MATETTNLCIYIYWSKGSRGIGAFWAFLAFGSFFKFFLSSEIFFLKKKNEISGFWAFKKLKVLGSGLSKS